MVINLNTLELHDKSDNGFIGNFKLMVPSKTPAIAR